MRLYAGLFVFAFAAAGVSGCSSTPDPRPNLPPDTQSSTGVSPRTTLAASLARYDTNKDGSIPLAELGASLAVAFQTADLNHDGHLDSREAGAVNDERRRIEGIQMSPIIDWNRDGIYALDEFSASARGLFSQFDRDEDEVVTTDELNARARRQRVTKPPPLGRQRPQFAE